MVTNKIYRPPSFFEIDQKPSRQNTPRQALDLFESTVRKGQALRAMRSLARRPLKLADLQSFFCTVCKTNGHYAGIQTVPIDLIQGSEGRITDFDRSFYPFNRRYQHRWMNIASLRLAGTPLPPVELIQVGETYFVRDGHHRISVAKALGEKHIDAEVIQWNIKTFTREEHRMNTSKPKHQLLYLFASSFLVLFVGMGLFPLLPIYAAQFGATPTIIGLYYASIYVANTIGSLAAASLATRFKRRSLFIAAGLLGIPALALMGQVSELWQLIALTGLVWFTGGLLMALANILTSFYADRNRRGSTFSLMSVTMPLGVLLGSMVTGKLVAWKGFELLFALQAALWLALPLLGWFGLKEPDLQDIKPAQRNGNTDNEKLGGALPVLLVLYLLSTASIQASRLGTSLSMQALTFPASAIASSATLSGLVALPVALLIGILSDRIGHKQLLLVGLLLAVGGTLLQASATVWWHFWLSSSLLLVSLTVSNAMVPTLATDYLLPEFLNKALARLRAVSSAAGILSYAGAGYIMDHLGASPLYLAAASLTIFAAFQLTRLRSRCGTAISRFGLSYRNLLGLTTNPPCDETA